MNQLAKLFIRGSLINVTAKNLKEEQKEQVQNLMDLAWNDPLLEASKTEFCAALKRTIGNEYANATFAQQEAWITFWRTAVDILYHIPDKESKKYQKWIVRKDKVLNDRTIRIKYFKTCLFNYLKQILKENKIKKHKLTHTIAGTEDSVAAQLISHHLMSASPKIKHNTIEFDNNTALIEVKTNLIPLKTLEKILKIKEEFKHSLNIELEEFNIKISPCIPVEDLEYLIKKVTRKQVVKSIYLSGLNDDDDKNNFQQHCEFTAKGEHEETDLDQIVINDIIKELENRLPETTAEVFKVMVSPSIEFLDRFYPNRKKPVRPRETHIAEWLDMSKNEVKKHVKLIHQQAAALDLQK